MDGDSQCVKKILELTRKIEKIVVGEVCLREAEEEGNFRASHLDARPVAPRGNTVMPWFYVNKNIAKAK